MTTSSPSSRASFSRGQTPGETPDETLDVLVIGEALVDVVDGAAHPGGSPANVAVALGRQGASVVLATQLGDDAHGELLRLHLAASHVRVVAAVADRTSVAEAVVGAGGAATYDFDVVWAPAFPPLPEARITHVGSFSALSVDLPSTPISYDINVRPALMPADPVGDVERIVARSTLVKASDEDLIWLYPDRSPEDSAAALLDLGPDVVWVTRGAEGSVALTRDDQIEVPVRPAQVVDTIGAGDTFAAGLVLGWLRWGSDWQRVGDLAATLAAGTVGRRGADPPWA